MSTLSFLGSPWNHHGNSHLRDRRAHEWGGPGPVSERSGAGSGRSQDCHISSPVSIRYVETFGIVLDFHLIAVITIFTVAFSPTAFTFLYHSMHPPGMLRFFPNNNVCGNSTANLLQKCYNFCSHSVIFLQKCYIFTTTIIHRLYFNILKIWAIWINKPGWHGSWITYIKM